MLVAAIDVGSPLKMGWATSQGRAGCGEPTDLIADVVMALSDGIPVCLGFEAPLWAPRNRDFTRMTANRGGIEASMRRPWSAGAGCGALTAGLANMAWVLEQLHSSSGEVQSTTQPSLLMAGDAKLLIWEAFVSGDQKADTHSGDAEIAVGAFQNQWPNLRTAIDHEPSVNLAAAALLATGHRIDVNELALAGVVVSATHTPMGGSPNVGVR